MFESEKVFNGWRILQYKSIKNKMNVILHWIHFLKMNTDRVNNMNPKHNITLKKPDF